MTDYKAVNTAIRDHMVWNYGDKPGHTRENVFMEIINHKISHAYGDYSNANLSSTQYATAMNHLAYEMLRVGYSTEAINIAGMSYHKDHENHALVVANIGIQAYAMGMIDGDYKRGLERYDWMEKVLNLDGAESVGVLPWIKLHQNRGQIRHRMGLQDAQYLDQALEDYARAFALLDTKGAALSPTVKRQVEMQLRYCRAKTYLKKARNSEDSGFLQKGFNDATIINFGVEDAKPGFEFEIACMRVVLGEAHALIDEPKAQAKALQLLTGALADQQKYGPTLVPRIESTKRKIDDVTGAKLTWEQENERAMRLFHFYGHHQHPDKAAYVSGGSKIWVVAAFTQTPK